MAVSSSGGGAISAFIGAVASAVGAAAEVINRVIEQAYRKGYEDGAMAMRDSILQAAQAPLSIPVSPSVLELAERAVVASEAKSPSPRAPRGSVGRFIEETLKVRGPLPQQELKESAQVMEGLSPTSIGNELRRQEGKKYRRDAQQRWHLIEESAAGTMPAAQEVYRPAA